MPTGIGAAIVSLTNGTTANAPDVLNSLNSLNSNGVSNDGGAITTNGSGVETVVGLIAGASGLTENGPLLLPYPSVQTLANNSTITLNTGPLIVVTCASAVTGIIMSAGATAGQVVFLYNVSSNSVTFAGAGGRVRGGAIVLNLGRMIVMLWDGATWTTAP